MELIICDQLIGWMNPMTRYIYRDPDQPMSQYRDTNRIALDEGFVTLVPKNPSLPTHTWFTLRVKAPPPRNSPPCFLSFFLPVFTAFTVLTARRRLWRLPPLVAPHPLPLTLADFSVGRDKGYAVHDDEDDEDEVGYCIDQGFRPKP
jgi:hypothetical protein